MAKGQAQAANKQLNLTNQQAGLYGGEQQNLRKELTPEYTALANTGYLSPADEAAATTSEMGAATAPFASEGFKAANEAAATRNPADLTSSRDALALEEGRSAGGAASNLQKQKMQGQEAGLYGLNTLETGDLSAMESLYGLGPSTLQARAAGGPPIGLALAQDLIGGAGAAAGG